ncbi:MAG TPA: type IV pilus secretin PilQ [Candidatus Aminicenantes bacterium]|nr:type IV pilus secretin PilQ [Candidatus Aminicenantes bacterium]HRY65042.1 type IV pilus secretin PilQ [Candidatus Aminicenantes bacterium]HRZ71955.1 type IV pilus secretin PilQ [Candidatus Aminicenantes bacterium]
MNKRTLPAVLAGLCVLGLLGLYAQAPAPAVHISRIQVQPGALATRLVLETDGPLAVDRAYYAAETPRTLVLDISGASTAAVPALPSSGTGLVRDVQVEKAGSGSLRILVRLAERVPARIVHEAGRAVVELNGIQRGQGGYVIDAATQAALDRTAKSDIRLSRVETAAGAESLSVTAALNGAVITQVFALENPPRLVVDLFDTLLAAKSDVWPIDDPRSTVQRVRVAQFQTAGPRPITRMVFDLKEPGLYALDSRSDGLIVSFFPAAAPAALVQPAPASAPAPLPAPVRVEPARVETAPKAEPKAEAKAPTKAAAREVPVTTICPPSPAPAPEAAPAAAPKAQEKAVVVDDKSVKFQPKTIAADEDKYSGEVLSLKLKDSDLRDVVLYLAEFAGLNVVFDPDVRGTVTVNLQLVPWDQALDIILKQNKMGKTIEGNILRVAPVSILTREEEEQRRLKESKELSGPVTVKTITLSYSKAKDVATLLRSKISTRGEIIVDERTNTLLISEVRDKLELLEKLIGVVDTPTPQVSIEARVVEASTTFIRNLGIQWGLNAEASQAYGNATNLQFPNSIQVDGAMIPQGTVTKGIGGPLGGYAVNLPAPSFNSALGLSFANVLDSFRVDVALSALETAGDGKIISRPSVVTQNNQQAEILQGRQIPVQTVANFTVTTRYVNAALELRATPQITAEGTIIMNIEIQNNAADFANLVNGIPPITMQSAKTTVMVPDGGTTVIGGIYRTEDSVTRERTPFLNQIPILGSLFKNYARNKTSRELLIFITPRIIK